MIFRFSQFKRIGLFFDWYSQTRAHSMAGQRRWHIQQWFNEMGEDLLAPLAYPNYYDLETAIVNAFVPFCDGLVNLVNQLEAHQDWNEFAQAVQWFIDNGVLAQMDVNLAIQVRNQYNAVFAHQHQLFRNRRNNLERMAVRLAPTLSRVASSQNVRRAQTAALAAYRRIKHVMTILDAARQIAQQAQHFDHGHANINPIFDPDYHNF